MSVSLTEVQQKTGALVAQTSAANTLGAESERVVALIQASFTVAKRHPRDINEAIERIKNICGVLAVAEDAEYSYNRGGKLVSGPNIRIAEIIASQWGNIDCNIVEIVRSQGESLVEAYALDLETNARWRVQFVVPHRRDKSEGGKDLTSDRDITEMVFNMGSRRVRECVFRVIPNFVVDAALEKCRETLARNDKKTPLKDRIAKLIARFAELGVTTKMLHDWLKGSPEEMLEQQYVQLRNIGKSIADKQSRVEDFFKSDQVAPIQAGKAPTEDPNKGPAEATGKDADAEIPHGEKTKTEEKPAAPASAEKPAQAEKGSKGKAADKPPQQEKTSPPDNGAPTKEDIVAAIEKADDADKITEIMSTMTGNPNLTPDDVKELRKSATKKLGSMME